MVIETIDLWTEQHTNHYECFMGLLLMDLKTVKIHSINIK